MTTCIKCRQEYSEADHECIAEMTIEELFDRELEEFEGKVPKDGEEVFDGTVSFSFEIGGDGCTQTQGCSCQACEEARAKPCSECACCRSFADNFGCTPDEASVDCYIHAGPADGAPMIGPHLPGCYIQGSGDADFCDCGYRGVLKFCRICDRPLIVDDDGFLGGIACYGCGELVDNG